MKPFQHGVLSHTMASLTLGNDRLTARLVVVQCKYTTREGLGTRLVQAVISDDEWWYYTPQLRVDRDCTNRVRGRSGRRVERGRIRFRIVSLEELEHVSVLFNMLDTIGYYDVLYLT